MMFLSNVMKSFPLNNYASILHDVTREAKEVIQQRLAETTGLII